jgi:alpha-beta hydrolase superfamily lysophospholipase
VIRTVVFIHDAWLGPGVWSRFAGRFAACGYACLTPAWPGLDQPVDHLRAQPPAGLARLGVDGLLDHLDTLVRSLPGSPLLVGHGVGGLMVQMLLDRGLGAAGVAIAPTPPRGVASGWSALRRCWRLLSTRAGWTTPLHLSRTRFAREFANTLTPAQQRDAFDSHVVPASGRLLWQTALGLGCKVDFDNDRRAALLFIAGERDRSVEASVVAANCRLQRRSVAVADIREFPGRSHWLIAEPGWEAVADVCIAWANEQLGGF